MKKILIAVTLTAAAAFAHAQNSQQSLMKTCNTEAGDKKGQERKDFMKTCLSSHKNSQQERMKACAAANKGKKGDQYKTAQKECLSKG